VDSFATEVDHLGDKSPAPEPAGRPNDALFDNSGDWQTRRPGTP
jgi:hypothetical protein